MHLYVEGGGSSKPLRTECREGFKVFLEKAGLKGKMPRIVACGGREQAFDHYCTAIRQDTHAALLLVDSEAPITTESPWTHLKQQDNWNPPDGAPDADCHLMAQCMESWFLADPETLSDYFGQGFNASVLPGGQHDLEIIPKAEVYRMFALATSACKTKSVYTKGEHSFKLLKKIDPNKVMSRSHWAKRLIDTLRTG